MCWRSGFPNMLSRQQVGKFMNSSAKSALSQSAKSGSHNFDSLYGQACSGTGQEKYDVMWVDVNARYSAQWQCYFFPQQRCISRIKLNDWQRNLAWNEQTKRCQQWAAQENSTQFASLKASSENLPMDKGQPLLQNQKLQPKSRTTVSLFHCQWFCHVFTAQVGVNILWPGLPCIGVALHLQCGYNAQVLAQPVTSSSLWVYVPSGMHASHGVCHYRRNFKCCSRFQEGVYESMNKKFKHIDPNVPRGNF
jgi:hypothetical protein